MSMSSSEISSDERWPSSITTSRRRGPERSRDSPLRLGRSTSNSTDDRPDASERSNPVAMTVTRTSSARPSSMTDPKMMFAFVSAALWMISAASLT
jgi:hypothetical protein